MRFPVSMFLLLSLAAGSAPAQPDPEAGRRSYEVCAGCHGFVGQGDERVGAPRLAGIEPWYLGRQILNFRDGRRGHIEGDVNGGRMALMAQAVESERKLGDLLAWISALPAPGHSDRAVANDAVTEGVARGSSLYAVCAACHGSDGRGNESLGAPALITLDDWYFIDQLRQYAEGIRGAHPADAYGAQMRALATTFATEDTRRELARFVSSLGR